MIKLGRVLACDNRSSEPLLKIFSDLAFARALELGGVVSGPRALNIPGAHSYLYPIFVRFRVITEQG